MIRRFGFAVVLVTALIVAACGRQVTPDKNGTGPGSGLPPGYMQIKYRVAQTFNFNNYSYVIVFNTSGDGTTPRANAVQTAYQGYSFAIIVSGAGGNVTATAWNFYRPQPNAAPLFQPILTTPQQLQLTLNSNGQNTEFTILFQRTIASAFTSPSPSASPTSSASPSTSPSASPTASASPSGSPSASPTPTPASNVATTWEFNYFVTQGSIQNGTAVGGYTIVDSLGANPTGATDATFTSPNLDTLTSFDTGPFYPQPGTHSSDPSSNISSGDISNNP